MNYAIIIAGGKGTRFWPVSRNSRPKQFLAICSARPMIEDAVMRMRGSVAEKNIFVAASVLHRKAVKEALRRCRIPLRNILFEPIGRNTLAPVALLSERIRRRDPDSRIAVIPSDHFIEDARAFRRCLRDAFRLAGKRYIVTMGITPHRPETGYGYIKKGKRLPGERTACAVARFTEKPDIARARQYLRSNAYVWNSGIFVFHVDTFLREVERLQPRLYRFIRSRRSPCGSPAIWKELPSLSIDYGVMEHTRAAAVLPVTFGWTDVGSWLALAELLRKDARGNVFHAQACLDLGSRNTFVWSNKQMVATVGLSDVMIISTPDALLVCNKRSAQEVRRVAELIGSSRLKRHA